MNSAELPPGVTVEAELTSVESPRRLQSGEFDLAVGYFPDLEAGFLPADPLPPGIRLPCREAASPDPGADDPRAILDGRTRGCHELGYRPRHR